MNFAPDNEAQARDVIMAAREAGERLEIVGGGTKEGLGHAVKADHRLSTRGLGGIVTSDPAEMVMTAKAGTKISVIEATLSEHQQMLAFEPVDFRAIYGMDEAASEPTIGGIFATNMSGPRRLTAGAARDALLGVRFINGFGEIIKNGGRVMKNVTGLDIVKLMAGSYGTLGLMSEVTFKVLPRPQAEASVMVADLDDEGAARLMASAMGMSFEISGCAFLPESCVRRFLNGALKEGGVVALRLEGPDFSVAERVKTLGAKMASHGSLRILEDRQSSELWTEIRDVAPFQKSCEKPLWRVSVAPMAGAKLLGALRMETGVDGYYDWQGGLLWLQMEADPEAESIRALIHQLGGGHATLVRANEDQRAKIFEPMSGAIEALSERIRQKFDPDTIFNPGRMG